MHGSHAPVTESTNKSETQVGMEKSQDAGCTQHSGLDIGRFCPTTGDADDSMCDHHHPERTSFWGPKWELTTDTIDWRIKIRHAAECKLGTHSLRTISPKASAGLPACFMKRRSMGPIFIAVSVRSKFRSPLDFAHFPVIASKP